MKSYLLLIIFAVLQLFAEAYASYYPYKKYFYYMDYQGVSQWEMRSDVNRYFSYRLTGYQNNMTIKREENMVAHSLDFSNKAVATMFDWHPVGGGFRVTTGLFFTSNEMDFISEPVVDYYFPGMTYKIDKSKIPDQISYDAQSFDLSNIESEDLVQTVTVGDYTVDVDLSDVELPETIEVEAGTIDIDKSSIPDEIKIDPFRIQIDREDINVTGNLKFKPIAPYLGFGWSNRPGSESRVRFGFDVGVMYHQTVALDMQLNGRIMEVHPRLTEYLQEEFDVYVEELEEKANEYKFMPYASLGISILL